MERNIPKINPLGRFYFFLGLTTMLLIFSSGEKWNFLLELTGIHLPNATVISIGLVVSVILGYLDKIDGKPNLWIMIIYPLGFFIAFYVVYLCFNALDFTSISGIFVVLILFVPLIPGFALLKLVQSIYNKRLEARYWEEYDRNRANALKKKEQ